MSRQRGRPLVGAALLATVALACLLALPSAASLVEVTAQTPLIQTSEIDVTVAPDSLLGPEVGSLLPTASLDLPLVKVKTAPGPAPEPGPAAASPPPAAAPPTWDEAASQTGRNAAGAVALGAFAAVPALPWETLASAVSSWTAQARETLRPVLRPAGRFLKGLAFLVPLFSRVDGTRLLENPVRARIHDAVSQDPGISLQDVRDRAGIAWGTTVHHLARLERHGLVVSVRHGNHRRWFPVNTPAARQRRELTVLSHPTAHRIAAHVAATPGTDQKSLCAELGLQNPAASKHLARFERLGLIQSEPVGRSRRYQATDLLHAALSTLAGLGGMARTEPVALPAAQAHEPRRTPLAELPEAGPMMSADVALAT